MSTSARNSASKLSLQEYGDPRSEKWEVFATHVVMVVVGAGAESSGIISKSMPSNSSGKPSDEAMMSNERTTRVDKSFMARSDHVILLHQWTSTIYTLRTITVTDSSFGTNGFKYDLGIRLDALDDTHFRQTDH
jgi:hypothetical protein